jgi:NADPH:quinone reductase-like Zn-dependent oxidoreductase
MKALQFSATGDLAALRFRELDMPVAAPGEVLVEIRAAGLNPSDVKNVLGRFPYTTLPRIPGRDFAGVILSGPEHLRGQEVWGSGRELGFTQDGSHAQYMRLPASAVALKPASMSFSQAAAVGVPYITALDALDRCQVVQGTRVLIIGAGAVGSAAFLLAKSRGAWPLMAVRRREILEHYLESGDEAILLRGESDLAPAVAQAFDGSACEVVFDTTGFWLPAAIDAVGRFGRIAVVAAPVSGVVEVPILSLYRRGGVILGVNSALYSMQDCVPFLNRIGEHFTQQGCAPSDFTTFTLEQAPDAYRRCDAGSSEKIVLVP